ncbi:MAG: 23S rRNA (pseudouridine(1915)-N(3))-methyltransferase RlmH [Clostridia bacterium]|nr:23S rRNA (pseudouridine(1915)-N(3))-methyltransferase RlmH [Clostridia bacterium]
MYKINLYCVGNLKDKEFVNMCNEYSKRISKYAKLTVYELKEKNNLENIVTIIESESQEIISKVDMSKTILFDVKGDSLSSEDFAKLFENWFLNNSEINFVIGGSYGVSDKIKSSAVKRLSVSEMTFPHRLFRVMALEQIYRAFTIINNSQYHK